MRNSKRHSYSYGYTWWWVKRKHLEKSNFKLRNLVIHRPANKETARVTWVDRSGSDWTQLIHKHVAPAENQSFLVKINFPLFHLLPKHQRDSAPFVRALTPPTAAIRSPAYSHNPLLLESQADITLITGTEIGLISDTNSPGGNKLAPNVGLSFDKASKTPFQADAYNRSDNTGSFLQDEIDQHGERIRGPASTAHRTESSESSPTATTGSRCGQHPSGSSPCGETMHTDTASVTSVIPTVVLRVEEYLFSGDPDEDPEVIHRRDSSIFCSRTPRCRDVSRPDWPTGC
jgi:hypothetical protein